MKENQHRIKQRIFDTAVRLFARKSYGLVGVREIAAEAGVSLSMISYHFNGKAGILQEILREHFQHYKNMMEQVISDNGSFEDNLERFIRANVQFIRQNHDLSLVWNSEMNNDIPEVNEVKKQNQLEIGAVANKLLHPLGLDFEKNIDIIQIVGPVVIQMIYSHFIFCNFLEFSEQPEFDDAYYERYSDVLVEMILNGVNGLIAQQHTLIQEG